MKNFFLSIFIVFTFNQLAFSQEAQYPIVKGFGGIYPIDNVAELPKKSLKYKIVIDIKGGDENEEGFNASLNNIARMLNLHGLGGVKAANIEVVAVIHSKATPTVLSNEAYQKKHGKNNPNKELIEALSKSNVKLFVCGQSLLARGFKGSKLLSEIKVSISALTILTTYQLEGYALLTF